MRQALYIHSDARGRTFLDSGTEVAGSTTGAVAGLFVEGPAGAVAGAALGPAAAQARWVATEDVLLTARDAFEERMVRHIGYFFANVAVRDDIDAGLAAPRRGEA